MCVASGCGGDDGGSLDPKSFEGKQFKDLSVERQRNLCVSVKGDLAPLEQRFDSVYCTLFGMRRSKTQSECEHERARCLQWQERDKLDDPQCEKELLSCQPQTRVDEYLACVAAIKKLYAETEAKLPSCDPTLDVEINAPKECLTFSVNVYCEDSGGLVDADPDYW
jgi:hypothetical protein